MDGAPPNLFSATSELALQDSIMSLGCTVLIYNNDILSHQRSFFHVPVPHGQMFTTTGYSSISLADLLQALRIHLFTLVNLWGDTVDIRVQELLNGVCPLGTTMVRYCTFRIPDFDQYLPRIKRNPTYGFISLSMHGGAMAQVISIGSMLLSDSHVKTFLSMWELRGLFLDHHFILVFDNAYTDSSLTIHYPDSPIGALPVPFHGTATPTENDGRLELGQGDLTDNIPPNELPCGQETSHNFTSPIRSLLDIKAVLLLGGVNNFDLEACRFHGHAKIIPSAKSTFSMETLLQKLTQITGEDLMENIAPSLDWSPASYNNKIRLFSWARRVATGHHWVPQQGQGATFCADWDSMVLLFKVDGAISGRGTTGSSRHNLTSRKVQDLRSFAYQNPGTVVPL